MKLIALLLVAGSLVVVGCGGSDSDGAAEAEGDAAAEAERAAAEEADSGATEASDSQKNVAAKKKRSGRSGGGGGGTEIEVGDSAFGDMLFDSNDQAIYIFENDREDETVCYGQCAADWPPVFTDGKPQAGKGVDDSLLGTVKRRDGKLQVTYDGQPLYYYVDEAPGEVRCHNVNLNGGFWWVVGPDGERLQ